MAMLRKLGDLADMFLKERLRTKQSERESELTRQRQEEVYKQNLATKQISDLGPLVQSGEIGDPREQPWFATAPPEVQQAMTSRFSAAPTAERRAAKAAAPIYKDIAGAKSAEELGSEDANLGQAKASFQSANVPLTSGDDNPMWAVKDAFGAQQKQIGANDEAAVGKQIAEHQSNYDIDHPGPETKEVGGFLFEKQPDGKWRKVAEGRPPEGRDERPYFQLTPTYDAQGRPNGAIRLEGRTGRMERVGESDLGGQLRPPQGSLGEQTVVNESALDSLDNLEAQFNGGAKFLVGPLEGRLRTLGQNIPGVPVNEDFANFAAANSTFGNAVLKTLGGVVIPPQEAARIKKQIPDVSDKPEVWMAKAAQTRKNLAYLEARVKADRGNGVQAIPGANGKPGQVPGETIADVKKRLGLEY